MAQVQAQIKKPLPAAILFIAIALTGWTPETMAARSQRHSRGPPRDDLKDVPLSKPEGTPFARQGLSGKHGT